MTVLEAAIPRKSAQVVQLLLNGGARITESAFAKAAEYCNLNTVDLFIKSGARVTKEIIRCAAKNEESEPFWFLLDIAEDDIKHECKCAALVQCFSDCNLDLIDKLIASGARLNSDFWHTKGIEAVIKRGDTHVLRLFLDMCSRHQVSTSLGRALTAAILCGQNDATEMLLAAGPDVSEEDSWGFDPLLAAISRENSHLIRRLLGAGAAVNKTSHLDWLNSEYFPILTTALPAVVSWGDYFLIQDINNAGADINTPGYF
jgi:hypothetical protein